MLEGLLSSVVKEDEAWENTSLYGNFERNAVSSSSSE